MNDSIVVPKGCEFMAPVSSSSIILWLIDSLIPEFNVAVFYDRP